MNGKSVGVESVKAWAGGCGDGGFVMKINKPKQTFFLIP
jgi:hypothetical protein